MVAATNERKLDALLDHCIHCLLANGYKLVKFPEFKVLPFKIVLRFCESSANENDFFAIIAWTQANSELDNNTSALFQAVGYQNSTWWVKCGYREGQSRAIHVSSEIPSFCLLVQKIKQLRKGAVNWILRAELQEPLRSVNHLTVLVKVWLSLSVLGQLACISYPNYPSHFKFVHKGCRYLFQGIAVGIKTCPSANISPPHTDGIDMVGFNIGDKLDGRVAVTSQFLLAKSSNLVIEVTVK